MDEQFFDDLAKGLDEGSVSRGRALKKDETIRSQQEQIDFLRRELERKDALMLNMTEAMKALTPPPDTPQEVPEEPPEWPESAEGKQYGTSTQEAQESLHDHRPWWQRRFGG